MKAFWVVASAVLVLCACAPARETAEESSAVPGTQPAGTFGEDLNFLREHGQVAVLSDASGESLVAVCPAYQGRVMTSTAQGHAGRSFGWINRELVASGEIQEHMNAYGGEDRIWLGPEGGQFSVFFAEGADFDVASWHTPAALDTEPFEVVEQHESKISLRKPLRLTNYSGATFDLRIDREVEVLDASRAVELLGVEPGPGVASVVYESRNTLTNTGSEAWQKETGLLSIWILGMFRPSAEATVVVPFAAPAEPEGAGVITTDYFGEVPPERLVVRDGIAFFKADGRYRSKIGIPRPYARPVAGSYDPSLDALTIVQFDLPEGATDYVDSRWKIHEDPYAGDVVNSYNDGPLEDGSLLGPFYELETSSPAAALAPGESLTHVHRTFHFVGGAGALAPLSREVLGVDIDTISAALP